MWEIIVHTKDGLTIHETYDTPEGMDAFITLLSFKVEFENIKSLELKYDAL